HHMNSEYLRTLWSSEKSMAAIAALLVERSYLSHTFRYSTDRERAALERKRKPLRDLLIQMKSDD
ncbi:hypothetical protein C3O70_22445, partial [Cronobacter sakazakii]